MAHDIDTWRAELDLRVFVHLIRAPHGRADIDQGHALGIRTEPRSLHEVAARIHHMLAKGWIDGGERTAAGVRDARLSPSLQQGLAVWRGNRSLGDSICGAVCEADGVGILDPGRLVALRDEAIFYC